MNGKERVYEDDDGRTIADMSAVPRPGIGLMRNGRKPENPGPPTPETVSHARTDRPWEEHTVSREERRMYVFGALRAALLIAFAFIGGLALVTAFLLWVWG